MENKICVPPSISSSLGEFLKSKEIALEIVADEPCNVKVIQVDDRKESDMDIIYSGGWIVCETARALAKKLGIPISKMGELMDHLDVKIRRCSLGCFK
jgi:hypothetical protein